MARKPTRLVMQILGLTLADISSWADDIHPSRPSTAPWHYVNIPREASGDNAQRD